MQQTPVFFNEFVHFVSPFIIVIILVIFRGIIHDNRYIVNEIKSFLKFFSVFDELSCRQIVVLISEGFALKLKHLLFEYYSAGRRETAHFAVAADYAVAGDEQRQWVFGKCAADGS